MDMSTAAQGVVAERTTKAEPEGEGQEGTRVELLRYATRVLSGLTSKPLRYLSWRTYRYWARLDQEKRMTRPREVNKMVSFVDRQWRGLRGLAVGNDFLRSTRKEHANKS